MIEKISIVIPYHGRLSLFKETLESLRKQSFKDFEVAPNRGNIYADDGRIHK